MTAKLTVRDGGPEGDYDAKRYGYWVVTGGKPEDELSGTIYLHAGEVYSWEIHLRVPVDGVPFRTQRKWLAGTKITGKAEDYPATYDEALAELTAAWPSEDDDAPQEPETPPDGLSRMIDGGAQ